MQLYRKQFAVLRALGASRAYVFLVMWTYIMMLVSAGAVLGLGFGYAVAIAVSHLFTIESGIELPARIGDAELILVAGLILLGAALALIPAWSFFRKPVISALR